MPAPPGGRQPLSQRQTFIGRRQPVQIARGASTSTAARKGSCPRRCKVWVLRGNRPSAVRESKVRRRSSRGERRMKLNKESDIKLRRGDSRYWFYQSLARYGERFKILRRGVPSPHLPFYSGIIPVGIPRPRPPTPPPTGIAKILNMVKNIVFSLIFDGRIFGIYYN